MKKQPELLQEEVQTLPKKPVPMRLGNNRPVAVPVDKVEQALALGYKKI